MKIRSKKAQHEIMGFVLIVVLVSIAIVIFLSLNIYKNKNTKENSVEISNLLQAAMYYTSDCAVNYIPQYREGQDLIKECYKNPDERCLNGKTVCDALKDTFYQVIENNLMVSEESPNKAYRMSVYYSTFGDKESDKLILATDKGIFGNCSSIIGGGHSIATGTFSGTINIELELCKGN